MVQKLPDCDENDWKDRKHDLCGNELKEEIKKSFLSMSAWNRRSDVAREELWRI